jgi:hypothetical protein
MYKKIHSKDPAEIEEMRKAGICTARTVHRSDDKPPADWQVSFYTLPTTPNGFAHFKDDETGFLCSPCFEEYFHKQGGEPLPGDDYFLGDCLFIGSKPQGPKLCNCTMQMLLLSGCKCGGI